MMGWRGLAVVPLLWQGRDNDSDEACLSGLGVGDSEGPENVVFGCGDLVAGVVERDLFDFQIPRRKVIGCLDGDEIFGKLGTRRGRGIKINVAVNGDGKDQVVAIFCLVTEGAVDAVVGWVGGVATENKLEAVGDA